MGVVLGILKLPRTFGNFSPSLLITSNYYFTRIDVSTVVKRIDFGGRGGNLKVKRIVVCETYIARIRIKVCSYADRRSETRNANLQTRFLDSKSKFSELEKARKAREDRHPSQIIWSNRFNIHVARRDLYRGRIAKR